MPTILSISEIPTLIIKIETRILKVLWKCVLRSTPLLILTILFVLSNQWVADHFAEIPGLIRNVLY